MDKKFVISKILEKLKSDISVYLRAADSARFEATDEHNKPESKYDTRGLEASYLAAGQSRQLMQTKADIDAFETMEPRDFSGGIPIDIGALVTLKQGRFEFYYLIAQNAGGTEIEIDDEEVLVLTPDSPLGAQVMGKCESDKVTLKLENDIQSYTIISVE